MLNAVENALYEIKLYILLMIACYLYQADNIHWLKYDINFSFIY